MKKLLVILLSMAILMTTANLVFADPQNGGDEPFELQSIYMK